MSDTNVPQSCHPAGGLPSVERDAALGPVVVDTYAGPVQVEWDPDAAVTSLGHLAFFAEYLKLSGRFDALVADCPLVYSSPNAPAKRDVLGTAVLSILAGHWRYAHITALRGDTVNPPLLGMTRVVSEDAVRRGLDKIEAEAGARWLSGHLDETVRPLLTEPWILDVDTTVKPLYGHQEGAVVGYNPLKPGRPSHAYHSFMVGGVRLILDVAVEAGNCHASKHSEPHLWNHLGWLPTECWPTLVRGDKDWGNQRNMRRCEQEGVHYLFKLRLTGGVRHLLEKAMGARRLAGCRSGLGGPGGGTAPARVEPATAGDPPAPAAEGAGGRDRRHRRRPGRAVLGRSQGWHGDVGGRRARHLPRPRDPLAGSALPGSRRQRKSLRRVEEPPGLGRLHHPRPEALPDHGPPDRARLQLVDAVRAAGRSRPSPRGPDHPPAAAARYRPPDPPCRPDPPDHHC